METERKKESFWRTVPGVLTGIGAAFGGLAAFVAALHTAGLIIPVIGWLQEEVRPPAGHLDDALKWWLAYGLFSDSSKVAGTCEAVIVHYQVPYSENLAEDMAKVLDLARWRNRSIYSTGKLPQGLSMKAPPGVPNECANLIRARLAGTGVVSVNMIQPLPDESASEYLDGCTGCFEINIGNDPSNP